MDGDKVVCVVLTESTELSLVQKALEEGGCVVREVVSDPISALQNPILVVALQLGSSPSTWC